VHLVGFTVEIYYDARSYKRKTWYLLFCMDDCLVCRVEWINSTLHTRQSSIQSNKYQVSHKYSCFSRWWAYSRQKHVEKRNKHTKKNRAPSWHYLQDHTRTQGQRNIKLMTSFTDFTHSRGIFSRLNEKCGICGTLKVNIHKISVQTLYEHKLYK